MTNNANSFVSIIILELSEEIIKLLMSNYPSRSNDYAL